MPDSREVSMFLGDSLIFWFFAICFVVSLSAVLILWERIRKQLSRALPADRQASLHPPLQWSIKELLLKTNVLHHSLELLEQHRKYYPSSSLRKSFGIALFSIIPSFIGFVISAR
jgi:hypothetical protein